MKNKMMYILLFVTISLDASQNRKRTCPGLPGLPQVGTFDDLEAYTAALAACGQMVAAGQASPVDQVDLGGFGLEMIDVTGRGFSARRQLPTESSRPRSEWGAIKQEDLDRDAALYAVECYQAVMSHGAQSDSNDKKSEKKVDTGRAADFPPFARATKDGGVCISITDSDTRKRSCSARIISSTR